jgi:uncharacterized protein YgiM (DUF1202 family)
MNKPNKAILHHSSTKDNVVLSSFDAIKNYHIHTKGWNDIGYHFVLEYVKGKIVVRPGRALTTVGAHTQGQNETSVGICIVGDFDKDTPTEEMYKEVAKLCKSLGMKVIEPHNKYATYKSCPGKNFNMNKVIEYTKDPITPPTRGSKPIITVKQGIVNVTTLNVREGRSTGSKIIGTLKKGDKVKVDKLIGDWYSIYYGKSGGFVHKKYLTIK